MDEMRIKSKFLAHIITKFLRRYFSKKFNANSININIKDLVVKIDEKGFGNFYVEATGSFTQDDISKITQGMLGE